MFMLNHHEGAANFGCTVEGLQLLSSKCTADRG